MDEITTRAFFSELEKIAKKDEPTGFEKLLKARQKLLEHAPAQAAIQAAIFGTAGGMVGHGMRPGLGTALGILAGGAGGAGLGYGSAKLQKYVRERKERKERGQ